MGISANFKKGINFLFRLPTDCSVFYGKSREFSRVMPKGLVRWLKDRLRPGWYALSEPLRIRREVTRILGQEFPPLHKKIEIDITYECNLRCHFCDRLLDLYPSGERMSAGQIEKFTQESIRLGRKWESIHLIGGEPILHPQILEIIAILQGYRDSFSPDTKISIFTNGCNNEKLGILPVDITIVNSQKNLILAKHIPVALAPVDLKEYKNAEFYNGCSVVEKCGMGLNMHGYYQCAVAGALDRILGLDSGRKNLPGAQDDLIEQYKTFCRYCGHFIRHPRLIRQALEKKQTISPVWKNAFKQYENNRPSLTRY